MTLLNELTVITITYNNEDELLKTFESLCEFRAKGGSHIIMNGGRSLRGRINEGTLSESRDKGIYDAINKGINLVNTKYFMLIHSGDFLVENTDKLSSLLTKMEAEELDILLNDCSIEFGNTKRLMKSTRWAPWMFKYGVQPPHPPIIYRTSSVATKSYDLNHPVIADFKYLEDLFKSTVKWNTGNHLLVHMSKGGATSSGLKSFLNVNRQFKRLKGRSKMIFYAIFRPILKVYLMI